VAVSRLANASSSAAAADWLSITAFYSSGNTLDEQKRAVLAAAHGTSRLTPAGVQALLAASGTTLASNTSILTVRGRCQQLYEFTHAVAMLAKHVCKLARSVVCAGS
jgi:hypothetical protein